MTDLDLIYPKKRIKGTFTQLMEIANKKEKEEKDLKVKIKKVIWEYRRIASKNRKGDWEEGRYAGIKEMGKAILECLI